MSSLKPFNLLLDFYSRFASVGDLCQSFSFFSAATLTFCSKRCKNVYLEFSC